MASAAEGGHLELVKLMLEKGATGYNMTLLDAVRGGNIEIVKLMLDLMDINNNTAFLGWARQIAENSGRKDIVDLIKSYQNK